MITLIFLLTFSIQSNSTGVLYNAGTTGEDSNNGPQSTSGDDGTGGGTSSETNKKVAKAKADCLKIYNDPLKCDQNARAKVQRKNKRLVPDRKPKSKLTPKQTQVAKNALSGRPDKKIDSIDDKSTGKPTAKGRKLFKTYLKDMYDNKHLFSADGKSCNYNRGQRLRDDFDHSMASCNRNFKQASSACDATQNAELQQAMAEVKSAIAEAESARGTSVQLACKKYTASAERLNNALNDFAGRCDPMQAQCQQTCYGTGIKSEGASMIVSSDPFCTENNYDSIMGNISSRAQAAGNNASRCAGFQSVVRQASNDAAELTNSRAMSQLCSQQVAKECSPQSTDPSCHQNGQQGNNQKISQFDAEGEDLRGPEIYDGFQQPEGFSGGGPRDASNMNDRRGVSSSQAQLSLAGAGEQAGNVSGVGKEAAARGAEPVDEELLADEDDDALEDEENLEDPENEEDGASGGAANIARANGNHPNHSKRSKELLKYLPGGANDPSAGGLPDGITGINGRSLFEKVSSRYADHRPRLDSFSRQVNQMNEKELKARVRQKMSVKRQLESRRKKKK